MNTEFLTKKAKSAGNRIATNIGSSRRNAHVSIPAMVSILCELGVIWFPTYTHQFHLTAKLLQGYALLAASNAGPGLEGHLSNHYNHGHHHVRPKHH